MDTLYICGIRGKNLLFQKNCVPRQQTVTSLNRNQNSDTSALRWLLRNDTSSEFKIYSLIFGSEQ
jgi:hypothetical protein